jgi:serine protease Do
MKKVLFFSCYLLLLTSLTSELLAAPPLNLNIAPRQVTATGFADIVEELLPAVVNISTDPTRSSGSQVSSDSSSQDQFEDFKNQLDNKKKKTSAIGSGFIISKDGFIVTNNHVVEDSEEIAISLNDGSKYKAKVIGVDKKTDLALLKINPTKELKFVKFGDSTKSRIGDWIIVIGNPYGLGGSVSVGIISARSRDVTNGQSDDFIQTDAAINKGNSGGPMFNLDGEVIGISAALFSPSGGNVGIGFATPSSTISQVIKQLREVGEVSRGWLGVSVQDISDEIAQSMKMTKTKGAFVTEVALGGPADKAGILPSDIIIKFDNQEVSDMKILPKIVARTPVGKISKITILRRNKIKVLDIKVAKSKDEEIKKPINKTLGKKQLSKPTDRVLEIGLVEISEKLKKDKNLDATLKGLMIVDLALKSEAAEKGIMLGDIILSANQIPLSSISNLKKIIEESRKSTKKIFLFIRRGNLNYAVALSTN